MLFDERAHGKLLTMGQSGLLSAINAAVEVLIAFEVKRRIGISHRKTSEAGILQLIRLLMVYFLGEDGYISIQISSAR